jgi:predicted glycosyltransferase
MCFPTGFIVLAQMAPEAAALGVPIPSSYHPHRREAIDRRLGWEGNGMIFSKALRKVQTYRRPHAIPLRSTVSSKEKPREQEVQ